MSVLNNSLLLGQEGGAGYVVQRSLRFSSIDSAYLSRTPASAGNRKTWTWAGWVKRSQLGVRQTVFDGGGATSGLVFEFSAADKLELYTWGGISPHVDVLSTPVFRDTAAWFHLLVAFDTTQAVPSTYKLYVNGLQINSFDLTGYPAQNIDYPVNSAAIHSIGRRSNSQFYFSGYLADVHFIDGQALTPSSFTETSATTGQLIPKAYSGSFGTNGFWLKFSDNSAATATTLGKDYSGNSNNWTPNNLSVTAGAGNDSLVDTPTSYGTDTGAGGEVRGNYATFNPITALNSGTITFSNGNLELSQNTAWRPHVATMAISGGKFYWEITKTVGPTTDNAVGILPASLTAITTIYDSSFIYYRGDGSRVRTGTTQTSGAATWGVNDVIGVALNMDAGEISFYKNGVLQVGAITGVSTTASWLPYCGDDTSATDTSWVANFGQRPFAYTAPSGFKALCDTNLPVPTIAKGSTVMDVKLYTGNGSTQTISGLGFSPDLVWIKSRGSTFITNNNNLFDSVRGAGNALFSDLINAETNYPTERLTDFTSNGFTVGTQLSVNGGSNVAWTWDAGSSTVTNTQGSITSQVRANASAGFSIVTATKSAGSQTFGHGLGVEPHMIILKRTGGAEDWYVYHKTLGNAARVQLNLTDAAFTPTNVWGTTTPTSTVFTVRSFNDGAFVAYCFAPVAGYSSFGSYTGNGSTDGPFVFCGFRPRFLLVKRSDASGEPWVIHDTARDFYNGYSVELYPNNSNAEGGPYSPPIFDFLSNGFKIRSGTATAVNASGGTFIYMALAESPFQYARAR